jgi:hypothetical protein
VLVSTPTHDVTYGTIAIKKTHLHGITRLDSCAADGNEFSLRAHIVRERNAANVNVRLAFGLLLRNDDLAGLGVVGVWDGVVQDANEADDLYE